MIDLQKLQVKGIAYHSDKVEKDFLFFAIPGFTQDGRKFIPDALKKGACAAVVESLEGISAEDKKKCILVTNVRKTLAETSAEFFGFPSKKLKAYGITGTKGKTSTVYLLYSILNAGGIPTALMSTVERKFSDKTFPSSRTTMESCEIQKFMYDILQLHAEAIVLEVSSHGLSLDRVRGIQFDGVAFLNLSEDHLDFYKNMENYYQAKKLLFTEYAKSSKKNLTSLVNIDDPYGQRLVNELQKKPMTYGLNQPSDFTFQDISISEAGISGTIHCPDNKKIAIQSPLVGKHNCYNILAAASLAYLHGIDVEKISQGINNLAFVPGRLQKIYNPLPFQVYVDFAHMDFALINILQTLRAFCKGKLIVVFGAGGDRPRERRIKMAEVAAREADISIITSDNPRSEDPNKIINEMEIAYQKEIAKQAKSVKQYFCELNREHAIKKAIFMAEKGDIICIAGKGHERTQQIGAQVFPFDDAVVAAAAIKERIYAQS